MCELAGNPTAAIIGTWRAEYGSWLVNFVSEGLKVGDFITVPGWRVAGPARQQEQIFAALALVRPGPARPTSVSGRCQKSSSRPYIYGAASKKSGPSLRSTKASP